MNTIHISSVWGVLIRFSLFEKMQTENILSIGLGDTTHFRKTEFVLDDETPHGLYKVFYSILTTDSENLISFSISVTASN